MDLTGVRADSSNGAADEQEEQVVAEGEAGTDGDGAGKAEEAAPAEVED
jgi:hypothetical protein